MKTYVYIDGFNLYYGCLQQTPYRWLDPVKLAELLLPGHEIAQVRYFTARVSARAGDQQQPLRQQVYLRALETLAPKLSIHEGHFLAANKSMRLATPLADGTKYATVIKTEEKGSDVNIATCLLVDGFRARYEQAVVVTNDSDLVGPIKAVRAELALPVGALAPVSKKGRKPSAELKKHVSFMTAIREQDLARCQLPETLADSRGTIRRPAEWG